MGHINQVYSSLNRAEEFVLDEYPLSPIQAGMLAESLYDRSGIYINQHVIRLEYALDPSIFSRAYQQVTARHSILRTALVLGGAGSPRQKVYRQVDAPYQFIDLRTLPDLEQEQTLDAHLIADRQRNFDLSKAPLHRMMHFQLGEERHVLVWTAHHVIVDGYSFVRFASELFHIYDSVVSQRQPTLPNPLPYRECVEWMLAQDYTTAERYWRSRLEGFHSPNALGIGPKSDRSEIGSPLWDPDDTEIQWSYLSSKLGADLRKLAEAHGVTLNTLFQGAWAILLSRYCDERDVVFGATRSCRRSVLGGNTEHLLGPLLNTLPVRVRVSDTQLLVPWLQELREQWVEMRPYENTPLSKILTWSDLPTGTPLFFSFCDFEPWTFTSALRARSPNWERRTAELFQRSPYKLVAAMRAGPEIALKISANSRDFCQGTAVRIGAQLQTLLAQMAEKPDCHLGELDILSQEQRRTILVEWNDTRRDYPQHLCAHQLVENQVQRTPEEIALAESWEADRGIHSILPAELIARPGTEVRRHRVLTYHGLNASANRLAHWLRRMGVGPDVVVGVCMERSLELIVALLATLKAGGVYLPLDPDLPPERLAFMFQDSRCRLLLTKAPYRDQFPTGCSPVLCLDSDWQAVGGESPQNLPPISRPHSLAYIIYTSGSTGQPKGVGVPHRALVNYLEWMRMTYSMAPGDRLLQLSSMSFDASIWNFLATLSTGVQVVLTAPPRQPDVSDLIQVIQEWQITILHMVPSRLSLFLDEPSFKDCSSVRLVVIGGEQASPALIERLQQLLPVTLSNNYGPTETAISVTHHRFQPGARPRSVPIGKPHPNVQIYILDHRLQPVPVGVPGELYIAGDCLARGYIKQPALTAERFLPDPFGAPGSRMYRSGDLARFLPDGTIEYLGRTDNQIKLRGVRIELGEIEAALESHPQVRQAVVLLREGRKGAYLAAYLTAHPGVPPNSGALRQYLMKKLPESMIPSEFMFLESLPRLPSGKIDRRRLAQLEFEDLQSHLTSVAPEKSLEKEVAEVFAQVLGLQNIGLQDDFFELGGDSLQVMRVISRLNRRFGVELPVKTLFETSTVEQLAMALESALSKGVEH